MEDKKRVMRIIFAFVMSFILNISLPYVVKLLYLIPDHNKLMVIVQLILAYWIKLYPIIIAVIMFIVFNVKKRPLGKTVLSSSLLNIGMIFAPAVIIRLAIKFLL